MWGPIASAAIGAYSSAKGQASANAQNLAIARENRAWQQKMSNTAYQRASADLEKAGLNRILALGSPSSTPAGNVATMGNVGGAGVQGAATGMQSGLAVRRLKQELKNMQAVKDKDDNLSLSAQATANLTWDQRKQVQAATDLLKQQLPGAQAEAQFWKNLEAGGSTAKGIQWLAPILKILRK